MKKRLLCIAAAVLMVLAAVFAFGCEKQFPSEQEVLKSHLDKYCREYGEKIIEEGHVMAICPEGKRIKDKNGVPQRAKAGVAVIAKATNASVLPVAICCDGPIKAGKKLTVSYGKLITPEEMNFNKEDFASSDIRKAANLVMDRITELWEAEVK